MIRILIPLHAYNHRRIQLVERVITLQIRTFNNVERIYTYMKQEKSSFYEGFLESENVMRKDIGIRLSDMPVYIPVKIDGMSTWVIEDGKKVENSAPWY